MVEIKKNGIVFSVEDGVLKKMNNCGRAKSVRIPHILANGVVINNIGGTFCIGEYVSIKISDEIENISESAFEESRVKKVRWSKGCKTIPNGCFYYSNIEEVLDISYVENIGESAFKYSNLKKFHMPPKCQKIPGYCFASSKLETISNLSHVTEVGEGAFECCNIRELVWPGKCRVIPERCFGECIRLRNISNIEDVEHIGAWAFGNTSKLTRFAWPSGCKTIPDACFSGSGIKIIENIKNVTRVGNAAFSYSEIEEIEWPIGCPVVPYECFWASKLKGFIFDNITHIEERAFAYVQPVSKLDMSNCTVMSVSASSFFFVGRENVIFPYYMPEEEVESALENPFEKQ